MIEVKPIVYTGQDYVLMGMIHAFRLIINSQEKEVNFEKKYIFRNYGVKFLYRKNFQSYIILYVLIKNIKYLIRQIIMSL